MTNKKQNNLPQNKLPQNNLTPVPNGEPASTQLSLFDKIEGVEMLNTEVVVPEGLKSVSDVLNVWYGEKPPKDVQLPLIDLTSILGVPLIIRGISDKFSKFGTKYLCIFATVKTKDGREVPFMFNCGGSVVYSKLMQLKEMFPLVAKIIMVEGDKGEYYDIR
jgi:hypothetical protein